MVTYITDFWEHTRVEEKKSDASLNYVSDDLMDAFKQYDQLLEDSIKELRFIQGIWE